MSSTCFTKKQVGFVYRAAKEGHIKIPMWVMTAMYDLSDFYGYANDNIAFAEEIAEAAIQAAIKEDWQWAQDHIDDFAEAFLQTGLKRSSRDARFIRGEKSPWNTDVLEDLKEEG